MEKRLQKGFTLIELMIALVIAGILLGVGVPSFTEAMRNSRISANYNSVAQALFIARSEAVKGSSNITLCPRAVGDADSCGSDWTKGIVVFLDNSPENTGATASLGPEDVVLHSQGELKYGTQVDAFQSPTGTGPGSATLIMRYRPTGETFWGAGYFRICDTERTVEHSRALNVVGTGAIRRGRPASATDKTPIDVFGQAIQC